MLTQIAGVSGRAILQALIDGEDDPDKLLTLVQRGVKAPPERLRAALQGRVTERHRFLLRLHLRHVDALDTAIAEIDAEVNPDLDPFRQVVPQLRTISGVSDLTAEVIVSEIGTDMSRFPTTGHLISWAGLCESIRIPGVSGVGPTATGGFIRPGYRLPAQPFQGTPGIFMVS